MTTSKAKSRSIGVVIVNYRTAEDCIECIKSVLEFGVVRSVEDVVVVDNASGDDSAERISARFPALQLLRSTTNAGFGAGVNLGVERCNKDLVLVLNPDTRFIDHSLASAVARFEDPEVGIVGLHLLNADGSDQHSARTFYSLSTILIRRTPLANVMSSARRLDDQHLLRRSEDENVPWVTGAGFLARREAFIRIGGMDERFFLYMEDTDLCRSAWRAGYKVQIDREAVLVHAHRAESRKAPISRRNFEHLRSLIHYTAKYGLPLFGHDKT